MKKRKQLFDYTVPQLQKMLDSVLRIEDSSEYSLDSEMKQHSRHHNEWAGLAAKANKMLHLEELELKQLTAEVIQELRQKHLADTGKPLAATYPIEKELVPLDERWVSKQKKIIELREFVDILSGVERRFNNRAWLLIQLSKRTEGDFEPTHKGRKRRQDRAIEMEEHVL